MILMDKTRELGATMITFLYRGASETAQYSLGPWIGKSRGGGSGSSSPIKIDGIKREKKIFLVKWLSMVYLKPVSPTLTLELQITASKEQNSG